MLTAPARLMRLFPTAIVAFLLSACVTTPPRPTVEKVGFVPDAAVVVSSKFDVVVLSRENFGAVAKSCMPTWPDAGTTRILSNWKMPLPQGTTVIHGHNGYASYLLSAGNVGVCIKVSEQRYPILAGEVLRKTANPEGVPPDVVDAWNLQIVRAIARSGMATIIYKFDNGNAYIVKYWADALTDKTPSQLYYWPEFKRVGQWTELSSDTVLTHPAMNSVSVVKYGTQHSKPFLDTRFN